MVQHTRREGNEAAHDLAKYSFSFLEDIFWIEECPSTIRNTVQKDAIVLSNQ